MLVKYLAITAIRQLEKIGNIGWIKYALLLSALFVVGGLFRLTGFADTGGLSLAGFFISLFFMIGVWIGLRYISTRKPNGYYFIGREIWLWSEAVKGKFLALAAILVTAVPYYTAKLTGYTPSETTIFCLLVIMASVTFVLFGVVIATFVRRISKSAPLRFILIILATLLGLLLVVANGAVVANVETQIFINPLTAILLPTLLLFFGISFVLIILLELLFGITTLSPTPSTAYWEGSRTVRLFRFTNNPATEATISSVVYLIRSTAFQRRLLAILLFMLAYPLFALFIGKSSAQNSAILAIITGLAAAIFYSIPLGKFSSEQKDIFAAMPQSKKLHPITELLTSTIVIVILAILFANLLTPFPGPALSVVIICTIISSHTILFYASYLSEQFNKTGRQNNEKIITVAIIVSLALSVIAISFLGIVSAPITATLIILWTALVVWVLVRSSYYLKVNQT